MIYAIMRDVETALRAKGCPIPFGYGPERNAPGSLTHARIVFERSAAPEAYEIVRSQRSNPRQRAVLPMAATVRVYAQSTLAGAGVHDHERLADKACDALVCAAYDVISARKAMWITPIRRRTTAAELELIGLQTWPGVAYEMTFTFQRGVADVDWSGEALETADLSDMSGTDAITQVGRVMAPESAC